MNMSKVRLETFMWCRNYVKISWIRVITTIIKKHFLSTLAKAFICLADGFLIFCTSALDQSKPKLYRYTYRSSEAVQIPGSNFAAGFAVLWNNRPWAKHPEYWKYCDFSKGSSLALLWCQLHSKFCFFFWSFWCSEVRNSVQNCQFG